MRTIRIVTRASLLALGFVAAIGTPASADKGKPGPPPAASGGKKDVKVYDFSGDTIEGDLVKPEGTTVDARDFAKHGSLIKIRTTFLPEIIKSAEDL